MTADDNGRPTAEPDEPEDTTTSRAPERSDGVGAGDDERESREHIAETGEPQRDALGNADGAS